MPIIHDVAYCRNLQFSIMIIRPMRATATFLLIYRVSFDFSRGNSV